MSSFMVFLSLLFLVGEVPDTRNTARKARPESEATAVVTDNQDQELLVTTSLSNEFRYLTADESVEVWAVSFPTNDKMGRGYLYFTREVGKPETDWEVVNSRNADEWIGPPAEYEDLSNVVPGKFTEASLGIPHDNVSVSLIPEAVAIVLWKDGTIVACLYSLSVPIPDREAGLGEIKTGELQNTDATRRIAMICGILYDACTKKNTNDWVRACEVWLKYCTTQ